MNVRHLRVDLVSEHASPLATLGGVDAGGQNVHVARLAEALAERGARVVVHTRRDDPDLPDLVPFAPGVVVHHVDAGPPLPLPKDDLLPHMGRFASVLAREWRRRRPDVVHSHFWMSGLAATLAARDLGIPVVHTFHALGTVKARHQGAADTSPPNRIATEQLLLDRCHRIVATCNDEVAELTAMGGDAARISVVPCGVDVDVFRPAPLSRAGLPTVAAVGRLVPRKGVEELIAAFAHLPARLVVIGGPDPDHLDEDPEARRLRAAAVRHRVADRVELRGRMSQTEVAAEMAAADVVACVPWYEPFGIVPLEAMACARPVVGTAVGGMLDTVRHGTSGLLVPPHRPDRIRAALMMLLSGPATSAAMGSAGRAIVEREYTWRSVAARTEAVYREVLAEVPAGARPSMVAAG
jgi:glycosyltransferase involved in cell wall biosynthesis